MELTDYKEIVNYVSISMVAVYFTCSVIDIIKKRMLKQLK